jgi:hypothetical protein
MDRSRRQYEAPRVLDYGGLQELTASCAFGTGGDKSFPSGHDAGGTSFGKTFENSEIQCSSK